VKATVHVLFCSKCGVGDGGSDSCSLWNTKNKATSKSKVNEAASVVGWMVNRRGTSNPSPNPDLAPTECKRLPWDCCLDYNGQLPDGQTSSRSTDLKTFNHNAQE